MIRLALYLATIPAANWMIGHVGTRCVAGGPCLVPVGFGQMAPSGVLLIGVALVLRDLVHRAWIAGLDRWSDDRWAEAEREVSVDRGPAPRARRSAQSEQAGSPDGWLGRRRGWLK